MAAGKSTVAQLLAEQLPRAAHVRGDMFRRFIVTGRVDPTPSMPPEAMRQLLLRYQLAMSVADAYVRAGFTAVVQDIIIGPVLADVVAMSTTRPRHVVVLNPQPDAVAEREAQRSKHGYSQNWSPRALVEGLRDSTPRLGLWLDTTGQTPADTVRTILARLPESAIDKTPSSDVQKP
jgi:predicted kinase